MFRTIPCPSSGAQDCVSHIVHAAAIQTSDRQRGDSVPHTVNQSLVLLMMGRELSETCWTVFKVSKLLLLHLVGPLLCYISQPLNFSPSLFYSVFLMPFFMSAVLNHRYATGLNGLKLAHPLYLLLDVTLDPTFG